MRHKLTHLFENARCEIGRGGDYPLRDVALNLKNTKQGPNFLSSYLMAWCICLHLVKDSYRAKPGLGCNYIPSLVTTPRGQDNLWPSFSLIGTSN